MIAKIDYVLDRITMYRLVLYALIGLIGIAVLLAFFHLLPFSPVALLVSAAFLVLMCWAMNTVFAQVFEVPSNLESATITALILALIIDPVQSLGDFQFLGWAAILAMASKYILALNKKHLFNPAAIAVVITSFVLGESASWWVGTASMLPFVLIVGLLMARKLRQEYLVWSFCLVVASGICIITVMQGRDVLTALAQLLLQSPLFFFGTIMLTEPLTAPPTKNLRILYAVLTSVLFIPQVHVGSIYSTPELALVVGNVFSYIVSPKQKVLLTLRKKNRIAPSIIDFVFKPSEKLAFAPGQYMEFTLAHPHPDSRGNRRYFTLASSPTENDLHLGVKFYELLQYPLTDRRNEKNLTLLPKPPDMSNSSGTMPNMSRGFAPGSSFKRAMYEMDSRTQIVAAQIAGDFTLPPDSSEKLVFIAGGIGITPFRSMLKYLLDKRQRRDIAVYYVNKTPDEIVYTDVLNAAQTKLGVRTFYTLTDTRAIPRDWPGFVGRISEQMIQQTIPDYLERTYYLSGPPSMVNASERVLRNLRIRNEQIKKDFFPGLV